MTDKTPLLTDDEIRKIAVEEIGRPPLGFNLGPARRVEALVAERAVAAEREAIILLADQKPLLTRGNIIGLVRQVADPDKEDPLHNDLITLTLDEMERFSALVAERAAAGEREACARVCDEKSAKVLSMQMGNDPHDLPNVMLRHQSVAHLEDAAAIRARGAK